MVVYRVIYGIIYNLRKSWNQPYIWFFIKIKFYKTLGSQPKYGATVKLWITFKLRYLKPSKPYCLQQTQRTLCLLACAEINLCMTGSQTIDWGSSEAHFRNSPIWIWDFDWLKNKCDQIVKKNIEFPRIQGMYWWQVLVTKRLGDKLIFGQRYLVSFAPGDEPTQNEMLHLRKYHWHFGYDYTSHISR